VAEELVTALSAHFQAEPSFRAVPAAGSNCLLLSGPKATLDDALAVLREIDRPARTIHLEILLVTLGGGDVKVLGGVELSGAARDVKAKVGELQQKGVITSVKTVQLTALERRVAQARISENRPFVTSVAGFGGRGGGGPGSGGPAGGGPGGGMTSRSISYRDVGTSVQAKPYVAADGLLSLDLRVEDSHMRSAEGEGAAGKDDKGTAAPAPEFVLATLESHLQFRPGQMVVAQRTMAESKSGQSQTIILVTAGTDETGLEDGK
jgi:type II secretory pathway component GspD/PulD (secretin)